MVIVVWFEKDLFLPLVVIGEELAWLLAPCCDI